MLTRTTGLAAAQLAAVRALAEQAVAHDGGRLKLEFGFLESEPVEAALVVEGDHLLGFAGVYAFGGSVPEIAGMVAPERRRQGLGTALLEALLPAVRSGGATAVLLVVPAGTPAGRSFAEARGASPSHSEHFLALADTPLSAEDPAVVVRQAVPADLPELRRLLAAAFGQEASGLSLDRVGDTTYVVERSGAPVGTVRLSLRGDEGGVYGFAVDPAEQGKGIGRDVLARVCRMLRDDGRTRVTLEVETQNDNALRLYTSTGFVREAGEDYWRVAL